MHSKNKNFLKSFIPVVGIIFFAVHLYLYISKGLINLNFLEILFFVADFLSVLVGFQLIFFPKMTIWYAILSSLFTILLTFTKRMELEVYFCFVLSVIAFWNQGFYSSHTKIKKILTIIGGILLLIIRILLLKEEFFYRNWKLCPIYLAALCLYLFVQNSIRFNQMKKSELKIELSDYPEITDRQKKLIPFILQGEKYDRISEITGISSSSVKRDAGDIFKIFFSSDRITFVSKYSSYSFFDNGKPIYICNQKGIEQ